MVWIRLTCGISVCVCAGSGCVADIRGLNTSRNWSLCKNTGRAVGQRNLNPVRHEPKEAGFTSDLSFTVSRPAEITERSPAADRSGAVCVCACVCACVSVLLNVLFHLLSMNCGHRQKRSLFVELSWLRTDISVRGK